MLTELVLNHVVTIAWFGLMTFVWLGWTQEDPEPRWRPWLGAGSAAGLLLAVGFGILVVRHWSGPNALDGRYHWFGLVVLLEVLAAGLGSLVLVRRGAGRWTAWWVAMVVALHFLPLAWLLDDVSIGVAGAVQAVGLMLLRPRIRAEDRTSSRWAGPWMGVTLLAYAVLSAVVLAVRSLG